MVANFNLFRNIFRRKEIIKRETILLKPSGTSGTQVYAGYYDEEYLTAVKGTRAAEVYDKMRRSDSQIAMLLGVVKNPIKSAKWSVESCKDDDEEQEIAEFVKHVLFNDIRNPETGKRKKFSDFIEEALTKVEFGHAVFEIVHRNVIGHEIWGDYLGLRDLGFRSQKTIENWFLNEDGSLDYIYQMAYGDLQKQTAISGEHLLVLSMQKEGDNYEGISMLRSCYGNWFRKTNYQKFMAIGIEKTSIGVPAAEMSPEFLERDDFAEQREVLEDVLENFAAHETNSLMLPAGVTLADYKISFDAEKVQAAIDSEDIKMTKRFLANFMELGMSGGGGSFALGSDLSDIFLSGIEFIAKNICENVNMHVIEDIVKAKYGARENYPKLVCRGINDKAGKEFAEIINGFITNKVLHPSDRLEDFINDLYGLPEITQEERYAREKEEENEPDPQPAPKKEKKEEKEEEELSESEQIISDALRDAFTVSYSDPPDVVKENYSDDLTFDDVSAISRAYVFEEDSDEFLLAGGDEGIEWAQNIMRDTHNKFEDIILANPKIEGKSPSVFISRAAEEFEKEMITRLEVRSDKMLDKVRKKLEEKGTNSQRVRDALKVSMPDVKSYREFMREYISVIGKKTAASTLKEVGKPELKLEKKDFDGLPRRSRERILKEIELVSGYQDADLEKMVYFSVNSEIDKGTPVPEIIAQIKKQRRRYLAGGIVATAATNILSSVVNGVRNDVYKVPEINSDIESFEFVNHDPKSAICKNLAGRVFSKEEYESSPYLPPLHHNCKSVIRAQTKGKKGNKPVDPKGLMPTGTDEEIEKILKSKTL